MKKLMALVLLVCLIVSALPVSAAQYIPELQVDMGYFSWQPAYAARDDGGIAVAFVYGGYCGDEWIEPEELRVDARTASVFMYMEPKRRTSFSIRWTCITMPETRIGNPRRWK